MTRRVCRVAAALCLFAIPLVLTVSAGADSASSFGWWYQLNDSALPLAPPPPPGAPSGGIYVQGTLAGPTAYGAVRFTSQGTTAGVISLAIESTTGAVEVAVCPTTAAWQAADGGVWQKRPTFDCSTSKALGVTAADGKSLTFQVTDAFAAAGEYDLAIVPDPTAQTVFSLSLTAPGPDFFTPTSSAPTTVPPVTEPPVLPGDFAPDAGSTLGAPIPDLGPTAGAGNFLEEPTATAPPSTAADPGGSSGVAGPSSGQQDQPGSPNDAERVMAGIGLALLAAGLWFVGNRSSAALSPELVKAGAISAHGGVGRFARVRTALPTRVA